MGTTMPNFKMTFTVYTVANHKFQEVATFNEAVRIARRLQAYGFKADVDVETWRNSATPQAVATSKTFLFRPNGVVKLFYSSTHYFHNGKLVKAYHYFN